MFYDVAFRWKSDIFLQFRRILNGFCRTESFSKTAEFLQETRGFQLSFTWYWKINNQMNIGQFSLLQKSFLNLNINFCKNFFLYGTEEKFEVQYVVHQNKLFYTYKPTYFMAELFQAWLSLRGNLNLEGCKWKYKLDQTWFHL